MTYQVRLGTGKPQVVDASGVAVPDSTVHGISFPSTAIHGPNGTTHQLSGPGYAMATVNGKQLFGLPLC